mgnify:CR=1 FL=1
MNYKLIDIETQKEIKPPRNGYEIEERFPFLGLDGKIYIIDDDGGCGDPECCGERTLFFKDVTNIYEIQYLK